VNYKWAALTLSALRYIDRQHIYRFEITFEVNCKGGKLKETTRKKRALMIAIETKLRWAENEI